MNVCEKNIYIYIYLDLQCDPVFDKLYVSELHDSLFAYQFPICVRPGQVRAASRFRIRNRIDYNRIMVKVRLYKLYLASNRVNNYGNWVTIHLQRSL